VETRGKNLKKKAGLSKYTRSVATSTAAPQRERGKREIVGLTVRLNQEQWRRIHEAALAEGCSIAQFFIRAASDRLKAKNQSPL
jgi:predicted HicB family RNase H-like nuclease